MLEECNKTAVWLSKIKTAQESKVMKPSKLNKFAALPVGTIEEALSNPSAGWVQLEGPDDMTATGVCSPKSTKEEVNRFLLGWAIHSMTKRICKKLKSIKEDHEHNNAEAIHQELALLLEMWVFEHHILDKMTNLQHFY
jgi:hypothetical protein